MGDVPGSNVCSSVPNLTQYARIDSLPHLVGFDPAVRDWPHARFSQNRSRMGRRPDPLHTEADDVPHTRLRSDLLRLLRWVWLFRHGFHAFHRGGYVGSYPFAGRITRGTSVAWVGVL